MTTKPVYLDYNATTPLDKGVFEAMLPIFNDTFGNPSSIHRIGRLARACLDDSRDRVATVFQCKPSEIVFTSGGTESNNLALFGTARQLSKKGKHIVTSQVEHHAVLDALGYLEEREGFEVTYVGVDREGRVNPDQIREVLRPDTILVSIMASNNEIGTLQPVEQIGTLCQERGILFHTDAAQWFGKEPVETIHKFHANLVSICAHKVHGPRVSARCSFGRRYCLTLSFLVVVMRMSVERELRISRESWVLRKPWNGFPSSPCSQPIDCGN